MRRLDNIDIRLLRVFVALADARGFADAQIVLNLSQSTLSTHLAELEKRLGAQLCLRGKQQFRLTEAGQATYNAAQKLFLDLDEFTRRVGSATGSLAGRLRLGASDGTFTSKTLGLQHTIRRFLADGKDVFLELTLGTPSELEQKVVDGELDIAIGPLSQRAPTVTYRDYGSEPHSLYCGAGHPLFGKADSAIDAKDIENSRFCVRRYRHFDDIYMVGHPKASASAVEMEAQAMMILSGHFIGFLPCHFAEPWVAKRELRAIKPSAFDFVSTHRIAFRTTSASNAVISAFLSAAESSRLSSVS
ncbi:LysR family transcriptional regulator [Rhizobium sp. AG855]|uniref:LysR family transcriptional regulator n=1 Tax=Rhizobium sp. AG855 TaxID=2183898 RepID=UPI000E761ED3|nr:LysR family transcriptional regulator [Rhizobium sp. AG855]RKE83365.1 LysR family transcriptional regulator [Rhizobium sp. AG855]